MNPKKTLLVSIILFSIVAAALFFWHQRSARPIGDESLLAETAEKPLEMSESASAVPNVSNTLLITSDEIARTANAKPCAKTVITHLDLSRPPTEAELIAAGNLGEPLTPTRPADPTENTSPEDKAELHAANLSFGHAIQAWNEHRYGEAYDLFEQHLKEHPASPWYAEAELHLGCYCQYNGRLSEAAEWFDNILKSVPKNSEMYFRALLRQSILHLDRGNFELAHGGFAEMKKNDPDANHQTYASSWIQKIPLLKQNETALRDCGQKALAKAAEIMGNLEAAAALRSLSAAGPHGYTARELHGTALTHGFDSKPVLAGSALDQLPTPFIAHYKDRHYVTVTGVGQDRVFLFDTRVGETDIPISSFQSQWTGFALLFAEPPKHAAITPAIDLDTIMGGCCGFPRSDSDLGDDDGCDKNCGMPGWSVNPVNYNFRVSDTPMWWEPPVGPAVMMSLLFNSLDSLNNYEPFGEKWSFEYASYLLVTPGSQVQVRDGNGRLTTFSGPAGGGSYPVNFTPPGDDYRSLVEESSHAFKLIHQDGTIYRYSVPSAWVDPAGPNYSPPPQGYIPPPIASNVPLLVSIEDRHGNKLSVHHNAQGSVVAISHSMLPPLNGTTRFWRLIYDSVNGHDRVIRIDDPFGRQAMFSYDNDGNLSGQVDMGGLQYGYGYSTSYGELFVSTINTPKGTTMIFTEPADGGVLSSSGMPQGYSINYPPIGWGSMWDNYRITITDPENYKTEYFYCADELKRGYLRNHDQLTKSIRPFDANAECEYWGTTLRFGKGKIYYRNIDGGPTIGTKQKWQDYYTSPYTTNGVTYSSLKQRNDSNGETTSTYRNSNGKIAGVVLPRAATHSTLNPSLHSFQIAYNYEANGIDVNTVQRRLDGQLRTVLDIDYYPNTRNVQWVKNALGKATEYTWNANGLIDSVKDMTANDLVTFEYDQGTNDTDSYATWRLIRIKVNGTTVRNLSYDQIGRVQTSQDSFGDFIVQSYDNLNRLTRTDYSDETFTQQIWECCFVSELRQGSSVGGNDKLKNRTVYEHDARGLITASIDSSGRKTRYLYDTVARLTKLTDPMGNETTWVYDGFGRLDTKLYPDSTYEKITWGTYLGQIQKFRSRAGVEMTVTFDEHQNLKTMTGPGINVTRTYDDGDNLDTIKDTAYHAGIHDFTYDLLGRVTKIDGPWTDDTIEWAYNESSRSVTRTSPGGITETVTSDALGRVDSIVNVLGTFTHGYDAETSRPLSITHSGGFDTAFAYLGPDDGRALHTITSKRPGGTNVGRHTYGYDDLGRIDSWQRESLLANPTGPTRSFQWSAHHDFASQLASVAEKSLVGVLEAGWDYGYDLAGNMSSVQSVTASGQPALVTRRGHNALNQIESWGGPGKTMVRGNIDEPGQVAIGAGGGGLKPARMLEGNRFEAELNLPAGPQALRVSATDPSGNTSNSTYQIQVAHAGARTFSHDTNGNLLSDGIRSYEWDSLSRLKKVTWDATRTTEFKYNALGQRCERIDKTGTTITAQSYYLFDGIEPVNRYTGGTTAGNIDRRYLSQGEQRKNGAAWDGYYYTRDHLGSIREVLASNGTLVARYDYDPYGKRTAQYQAGTYTNGCDLGFTGHVTMASPVSGQAELVLTHFRAYDPELGRWLSADPIGEAAGVNAYAYCFGNPLAFHDPDGLFPSAAWWGGFFDFDQGTVDALKVGAMATADGFIPFSDPFDYSGGYDPCHDGVGFSKAMGALSRDVAIAAGGAPLAGSKRFVIKGSAPGTNAAGQLFRRFTSKTFDAAKKSPVGYWPIRMRGTNDLGTYLGRWWPYGAGAPAAASDVRDVAEALSGDDCP